MNYVELMEAGIEEDERYMKLLWRLAHSDNPDQTEDFWKGYKYRESLETPRNEVIRFILGNLDELKKIPNYETILAIPKQKTSEEIIREFAASRSKDASAAVVDNVKSKG